MKDNQGPLSEEDWRLCGQEKVLMGATLFHRYYQRYTKNEKWDHDHCRFCWRAFAVDGAAESLQVGYTTNDDYTWICEACFSDFKERFQWIAKDSL